MEARGQAGGLGRKGKAACRRFLRPTALIVAFLLSLAAAAFAQSTPRGAEHDSFGRMVFDWDGPVRWSADTVNGDLVVRFERPLAGDPQSLLKPLAKYLKSANVSPDRRMVTFGLAQPVQLKTFTSGTSTVVDMTPAAKAAPASEKPAPEKPVPEKPAPKPEPPPAAAKAEAPVDLTVRGGEHTGFNRLVFDWAKPVGYSIDVADGKAVIAFDRPANVKVTSLEAALPPDVRLIETRPQGKGTAVVLALPADMRVRHFTSGPRVAVDLVRAAGSPPPPRAAGTAPPPLAPAPGTEEQPPAAKPLAPSTPAADAAATADAPAQPPKPAVPQVSLGVPFEKPTAAAAFRRAGWLWLVFDSKAEIDTKLLKRTGGDVVLHAEQVPGVRDGSAIRLVTRPGFNPIVRKEGQLWVFDLAETPLGPRTPLSIERQFDFEDRGRLILPVQDPPQKAVSFRDPEVGDTLFVTPLTQIGVGVPAETVVPGAQLLPTAQGVAMVPLADGARLEGNRSGVEVSMPGGLHLSRDLPGSGEAGSGETMEVQTSGGGPLDLLRWMRGGLDKFVPEHQKLLQRMAYLKPEDKNAQRLEIARHYLANAMPHEALGLLKVIAAADPAMVDTPQFRAVRGVANFLTRRDIEAIDDLSHPGLAKDPHAPLWLAAAKSRLTGDPKQALMLRLAHEDLKGLNPRLRMALGPVAARAAAAAGDTKSAIKTIEAMNGPGLSRRDTGTISYLQGTVAEAAKQWDQAIAKYREAEDSESRPDRAQAGRARIELQMRRGMLPRADAIKQLEKLRFAWREGDYEYELLKRLGELMIADGQYANGLRALREIAANYSDHPDIGTVQQMMAEAFEKLYLGGLADGLSPIAAIGLYDEFQELTPTGTKGDEMIRKLADRLAAVDLIDRAGELLRHQVQFRLQGVEKARVATRLAFLELSDRKPGLALEALDQSEIPDMPAELFDQRRYMRVRALADLGRTAEALALIINDQSDKAKQLRAEIYWDLKKWPEAAAAMEALIEPPEGATPIQPVLARKLVDLATAMTLARDDRGLQRLRRSYGAKMAATEFREAFDLLTSEPERGIIDFRRVGDKIKQVEAFQTFMGDWKNRVQAQGLSSIN
ncbi:lipopolysaccharide assembly protein LapB [Magnetospirillum sp. UT-4]|uniref:tetratricopeptide repeat protein n=1 Tax=Magnetospirillum sp. UT-4 TaxID=2681467 RepID=UPI001385F688|nr:hypothetical protein [Magnetospirillum sp. UT-4]CAA7626865.1 conserved exported hypothetical protein [Magnetospirillum sp. UT-4]